MYKPKHRWNSSLMRCANGMISVTYQFSWESKGPHPSNATFPPGKKAFILQFALFLLLGKTYHHGIRHNKMPLYKHIKLRCESSKRRDICCDPWKVIYAIYNKSNKKYSQQQKTEPYKMSPYKYQL